MGGNIILCVMGMMFPKTIMVDGEPKRVLPDEHLYSDEQRASSFAGIQANEASIKYLIEQGYKIGQPVTNVVYLCSDKVMRPIIFEEMAIEALNLAQEHETLSTEGFLIARIEQFCEDNGYEPPSFDPVAYNPLRPADSLSSIANLLWDGARISIDTTGGQRDAVLLLTIAIQIIKMGAKGASIGDIVYANLAERLIMRQNNTFDLVDLINAVNAFTEYGRANQLNTFFGTKKKWTSQATKNLVSAMDAFSSSLALCRIDSIEDQVRNIHACLDDVESDLSCKQRVYNLFTDAISQIDEASWLYELGFDDALQKLSEIDSRVKPEMSGQDDFKTKLREWQWDYVIERNELLFLSLIPTIKEKFIPQTSSPGALILGIIRWCVSHGMIQQALCIYREKISSALIDLGFFTKKPAFDTLDDDAQQREITNLCSNCSIDKTGIWIHQNVESGDDSATKHTKYNSRNNGLEVAPGKEAQLRLVIAWYKYLHVTRNTIMHVDSVQGNYAYFFTLALLGKDRDEKPDLEILTGEMLEALQAIESPETVTDKEWNEARSVASRDYRRFKQRVADGTTKLDKKAYTSKPKESDSGRLSGGLDAGTQAKLAALKAQLTQG